jgi:hypothetical protein
MTGGISTETQRLPPSSRVQIGATLLKKDCCRIRGSRVRAISLLDISNTSFLMWFYLLLNTQDPSKHSIFRIFGHLIDATNYDAQINETAKQLH